MWKRIFPYDLEIGDLFRTSARNFFFVLEKDKDKVRALKLNNKNIIDFYRDEYCLESEIEVFRVKI